MMRKLIVTLVAAIIGGAVAYAGSSTVNYTSSGSAPFRTTTDGTSNNLANVTIWDSVAGATGLSIVGQGATYTGQGGLLPFGVATTAAPTYPNNTLGQISLDLAGGLRVNCTTGCAASGSSFGAAMPSTGTALGLATTSPSSGNMIAWAATTNYGAPPAAIPVPAVNAFVTNSTAPVGPATATQSPVLAGSQNVSAAINTGGGLVIPASGTTKTYVMAWDVIASGTGSVTIFSGGTGGTCTGGTALTGIYNLTPQAGISKGDGSAPVLISASSAGICIGIGATPGVGGSITYQQF